MLEASPITLGQVKSDNTSKNLLNEICEILNNLMIQ